MSYGNSFGNNARRIRAEDLLVHVDDRPGWVSATERTPRVGEDVYTTAGAGVVTALLGKTGDGSRLMQIQLEDTAAKPFFAAASNVLVAPE